MANTFPEDHNNNLEWVDNTILFYATSRHATPRHAIPCPYIQLVFKAGQTGHRKNVNILTPGHINVSINERNIDKT